MENNNIKPAQEEESTNAKKQECLKNLWLALRDRYTKEVEKKELNMNDSPLRQTKR